MQLLITANNEILNTSQVISFTAKKAPGENYYQMMVQTSTFDYLLHVRRFESESDAKSCLLNNVLQYTTNNSESKVIDFRKMKV